MNDLPFVLCVIAIVLTIVTVVGHGIWLLLSKLNNALNGGREKAGRTCPFCRRSTPAGRDRCDWCGKDVASLVGRELSDLEAVHRQLQRFRQNGTLTPEVVDRLLRRLQDYRQRLLHPAAKHPAPIVAP